MVEDVEELAAKLEASPLGRHSELEEGEIPISVAETGKSCVVRRSLIKEIVEVIEKVRDESASLVWRMGIRIVNRRCYYPAMSTNEAATLVEARGLVKEYRRGHRVVDDVSFEIRQGETLGLVGESGSGKSTVARLLLRLGEPTAGEVWYREQDLMSATSRETRGMRRRMQIVFQDPYAALNPRMRVKQILTEPFEIYGERPFEGLASRLKEMLRTVGLDESALGRFPHEFSGGQRQRINIARALALRPEFLVLDEPVSALDVSVGAQVVNLLRDLQREYGLTYLFISHSMPLVRYLCDRVAVMQRGRLVELGECEQVCDTPRHEYTRRLIAATPEMPTAV